MLVNESSYQIMYGNIDKRVLMSGRNSCMAQCTGCMCNCSRVDKDYTISNKEWERIQ